MDSDELVEMGLTKTCGHVEVSQNKTGHFLRSYCGVPTIVYGGKCFKHSTSVELAKQAKAEIMKNAAIHRALLEDEVLPKAHARIMDILADDEAKDSDIIKIWMTAMDRVGLAAVSGLIVEGNVTVDAPLDILRRMLSQNAPIAEDMDTVDGEVVEDTEE